MIKVTTLSRDPSYWPIDNFPIWIVNQCYLLKIYCTGPGLSTDASGITAAQSTLFAANIAGPN